MTFINLNSSEQSKPIYRYTDFGRLVKIFKDKQLVLVRPEKWDDPFENYLIDPEYNYPDGGVLRLSFRHVIHGSCFTKKSVSDAMWRIYSPDKISVRIKTTPLLLAEQLDKAISKYNRSSWYIGKVEYLPQSKIIKEASSMAKKLLNSNSAKETMAAKSILFKRNSFSHEQEVRALIIDRHQISKNGVLKIKIEPYNLIQSILVDSRAPDEWLDVYTKYLRNEIGFQGRIAKSTLYKPIQKLVIGK